MPSIFRSLSARFRRQPTAQQRMAQPPKFDPRKQASCKVMLLDGTDLNIIVAKNACGAEVYDQVFYSLDLEERDYFGLLFTDHYNVQHWLDPLKKISKQVPIGPPFTFRFRVKFYTAEPGSNLREELTRYQFFLQLKHDILNGRLECPRETAVELAAYALQSELGDYDPMEHTVLFISEFRFHPEQDEKMEYEMLERYKLCRGQSPAQAEMNYLNKAKYLEMYGVDTHRVEGKDGNTYTLGLTPQGMLVFDGKQKIGLFFWEKIQKLDFKNKRITLVVEEDADQSNNGQIQLHTFVFNLTSHKACKHLWKCAIEHHTFFRLKARSNPKQTRSQLFRLGSTFKYRGRTEYETVHKEGSRLSRRTSSTFERRPSQRYGPRQSHAAARQHRRDMIREQIANGLNANTSVPTGELISHLAVPESGNVTGVSSPMTPPQSSHMNGSSPSRTAAAEARLDNLLFTQPQQQTSRIPTSSSHVTNIPIGSTLQDKRISPSSEKAAYPMDSTPVTSPTRSINNNNNLNNNNNSRIPKYVMAPMQVESRTPPPPHQLTPPPSEDPTPEKVQEEEETREDQQNNNNNCQQQQDDNANVTQACHSSSSSSSPLKPNSGIPKLSKSKLVAPKTYTASSAQPTGPTRIPKMASGGRPLNHSSSASYGAGSSSITYIPIAQTGIPSTQSRVITQL